MSLFILFLNDAFLELPQKFGLDYGFASPMQEKDVPSLSVSKAQVN